MVPEIDVSLTSISPRIGRLAPVVASILAQDPAPARVLIHLSRGAYLLDQGIGDLPADLAALVDEFPGLKAAVLGLTHGDESAAALAAAVEFLLEGLHLSKRLNKDVSGSSATYRSKG